MNGKISATDAALELVHGCGTAINTPSPRSGDPLEQQLRQPAAPLADDGFTACVARCASDTYALTALGAKILSSSVALAQSRYDPTVLLVTALIFASLAYAYFDDISAKLD